MTTLNNKTVSAKELALDEIAERSTGLVEQGNAGCFQLGWFYNYVVDRELAQKGGFKDAQDFFAKKVKVLSQTTLTLYGAVARSFTATACVKYGMAKLYTLLTYEKLASLEADGNEPGPTPIQVPRKDGTVQQKPFAECTVEELKLAVKHLRTPPKALPGEATARVDTYRSALDRHFPKDSHIRVSARLERGKILISLKDIPDTQMGTLVEALMDSLEPVREVA